MPILNNNEKLTDFEIEKALHDPKKLERIIQKILKLAARCPESSKEKLRKQLEPFLHITDGDIDGQRAVFQKIKKFFDEEF